MIPNAFAFIAATLPTYTALSTYEEGKIPPLIFVHSHRRGIKYGAIWAKQWMDSRYVGVNTYAGESVLAINPL